MQRYYTDIRKDNAAYQCWRGVSVGCDWEDDKRQMSLALSGLFNQTVNTCHLRLKMEPFKTQADMSKKEWIDEVSKEH